MLSNNNEQSSCNKNDANNKQRTLAHLEGTEPAPPSPPPPLFTVQQWAYTWTMQPFTHKAMNPVDILHLFSCFDLTSVGCRVHALLLVFVVENCSAGPNTKKSSLQIGEILSSFDLWASRKQASAPDKGSVPEPRWGSAPL